MSFGPRKTLSFLYGNVWAYNMFLCNTGRDQGQDVGRKECVHDEGQCWCNEKVEHFLFVFITFIYHKTTKLEHYFFLSLSLTVIILHGH